MKQTMTIFQMKQEICNRNGWSTDDLTITTDSPDYSGFEFDSLALYYKRHYRPLFEQLAKDKPDTAARFLAEDFDALFQGYLNEEKDSFKV